MGLNAGGLEWGVGLNREGAKRGVEIRITGNVVGGKRDEVTSSVSRDNIEARDG